MRKFCLIFILTALVFARASSAEEFLGAPVLPGGNVVTQSSDRLEIAYDMTLDKAIAFYRQALEKEENVKFRDRKGQTYIEDHGARAWHSIRLVRNSPGKITIITMKDNWTWILGTLVLRFIGVFAVLLCLYVAMAVSGRILSRLGAREKQPGSPQKPAAVPQ